MKSKTGGGGRWRPFRPGILPLVILLALFSGALIAVHVNIESLIGREIADLSIVIVFFGAITLWATRA